MAAGAGAAQAPAPGAQAALQAEMVEALRQGSMICFENALFNPTNLQQLMSRALDDGTSSTPADRGHWATVAVSVL